MKKQALLFALSLSAMLISAQGTADVEKITKTLDKQSEETAAKKADDTNLFEMNASLQVSNVGFVNWVAGGDNMFTARAVLFLHDNYTKGKFSLDQKFDARFGYTAKNWKDFSKSEDEFKYNILGLYGIGKGWSAAAMGNLRSQFANGHKVGTDTVISSIFAPAYLDLSLGFNYKKAPFSITLSPLAGNLVFVCNKQLAAADIVGIGVDKQFLAQVGASLRAELDITFAKKMLRYRSYLFSFVSYTENKNLDLPAKKQHIPLVRWENTLDFALNKWLTASAYALLYYNNLQSDKLQVNYSFGLGLAYAFKTAHKKTPKPEPTLESPEPKPE